MPSPKKSPPKPLRESPVRARYFPATANVTADIEEWAAATKVRVLAVIPVYLEDMQHD